MRGNTSFPDSGADSWRCNDRKPTDKWHRRTVKLAHWFRGSAGRVGDCIHVWSSELNQTGPIWHALVSISGSAAGHQGGLGWRMSRIAGVQVHFGESLFRVLFFCFFKGIIEMLPFHHLQDAVCPVSLRSMALWSIVVCLYCSLFLTFGCIYQHTFPSVSFCPCLSIFKLNPSPQPLSFSVRLPLSMWSKCPGRSMMPECHTLPQQYHCAPQTPGEPHSSRPGGRLQARTS